MRITFVEPDALWMFFELGLRRSVRVLAKRSPAMVLHVTESVDPKSTSAVEY